MPRDLIARHFIFFGHCESRQRAPRLAFYSNKTSKLWGQKLGLKGSKNLTDKALSPVEVQKRTYVLRLSVADAAGNAAYAETSLIWDATLPVVNAGVDVTTTANTTLDATVTDANPLTHQWTVVSGSGMVTFGAVTDVDPLMTLSMDGPYVLRLTSTDSAGNSSSGTMTYIKDTSAPSVNAGSDTTSSAAVNQNATVSDLTT